jgi:DNA repair photolyase
MDRKYKVTLNILKYATIIYTRSDLIAHDDYTAELKKDVKIYIVYNSTNADVNNTNEPGCPSYLRRVKAVDKLKDLGFNAILINEKRIKALKAV